MRRSPVLVLVVQELTEMKRPGTKEMSMGYAADTIQKREKDLALQRKKTGNEKHTATLEKDCKNVSIEA
jgi:hypothetical protein